MGMKPKFVGMDRDGMFDPVQHSSTELPYTYPPVLSEILDWTNW